MLEVHYRKNLKFLNFFSFKVYPNQSLDLTNYSLDVDNRIIRLRYIT